MKKTVCLILMLIAAYGAVAVPHKHKKKHSSVPQITSVTLWRTGCYGRCPTYTVKIDNTGMVTYTGERFVTDTGAWQKSIGSDKAMDIIKPFYTYQADTCQDVYYNRVSDLPGIILTIVYTTHTKRIVNAHFGPQFLKTLATTIDNAGKKTDDSGWTKAETMKSK